MKHFKFILFLIILFYFNACSGTKPAKVEESSDKLEQIASIDTNSEEISLPEIQNPPTLQNQISEPIVYNKNNSYIFSVAGPDTVELNQPFWCDVTLKVIQDFENAIVKLKIPEGLEYVESIPKAKVGDNYIFWKFPNLSKNDTKNIRVKYIPKNKSIIKICGKAQVTVNDCFKTTVTQPAIAIKKTGPKTAVVGEIINYTIAVKNNGDGIARSVVIKDIIPPGLKHLSKKKVFITRIGNLAPGQEKIINIPLKAVTRGKHCNKAIVNTSNAGTAEDTACTTILLQNIKITKTGPKEQFFNKKAKYVITVKNTEDSPLHDIVVTDTIPSETRLLSAPGGKVQGNTIVWKIAKLDPGQIKSFSLILTSSKAGTHVNYVNVNTREGLSRKAYAKTLWRGFAALLIEVVDVVDPLFIGEKGKYIIKVTNQGTGKDSNIKITAFFPPEITPTKAKGVTRATTLANGQMISFAPYPSLAPKQTLIYEIDVKANSVGDARIKVQLKSDLIKTPVTEEESTHVY